MTLKYVFSVLWSILVPAEGFGRGFFCLGSILENDFKGLPRWGIFGLPLTHRVKILQKIKSGTSHITHHKSHIAFELVGLQNIRDKRSCAIQQFI